jgi:hypothetical protein
MEYHCSNPEPCMPERKSQAKPILAYVPERETLLAVASLQEVSVTQK